MKEETFTFLARDGANTLITLAEDGVIKSGDGRNISDLSAEELCHIIKRLVDLYMKQCLRKQND